MPLVLHESILPAGEVGLWRIEEPEDWFRDRLLLYPAELRQLSGLKGAGRRIEWLAARQLVHEMSGREVRGAFVKDEYGKPHLEGSDWQISISHTHQLSAAMAAPGACGIDVQILVPKIVRLSPKFLHDQEAADLAAAEGDQLIRLHFIWGAKEALYKAYGRREIDWRFHLRVAVPSLHGNQGTGAAWVDKDGQVSHFVVHYRIWEGQYFLVQVLGTGS